MPMESNPVRIDELLAHAGWVRALAARLVRDPAAADDVTQEVWASALRSPPHERTNLRGWFERRRAQRRDVGAPWRESTQDS